MGIDIDWKILRCSSIDLTSDLTTINLNENTSEWLKYINLTLQYGNPLYFLNLFEKEVKSGYDKSASIVLENNSFFC